MKTNKSLKWISILLIITLLGNLVLLPGAAQAQPQAVPPAVASVIAGGERFMDAAPQALGRALQLAQRLDYISQVELADLSETTLIQARQDALATAEQAATAQGAVGAIANGLTDLNYQVQAAADMNTEVSNLESSGFDAELETALANMGLTSGQISELEDEAAANFSVRSALPTETVTLLQEAGLSQAEIDQVEQTLADYGLADNTLSDRLAQFRASQQELSVVRTEALVAYLQLLTKQVFVRQLAGETGRELTSNEVDEGVKDQLRLLIHLGYLDTLWNGNPDPNVGEGQWLFVERYSLRVAERLDSLILETQNVGLIVDLLVALQIHSTALAALAGDAAYAKAEVDPLADFLETMLGDNLPGNQGYRHAAPPLWWEPALALGDYNPALATGYQPELAPEAITVAQEQVQGRIKGLAYPLWFQSGTDPDPTNNQAEMYFQTAPPLLPPGVLAILNQVMGGSTPLEFIWEVLTGQSENWWAIGGNIVLSFAPVAGTVLDLISLFTDPTLWGKAMSLIGLVASIISDGAEILAAVGVVVPPALLAVGPAIGAEAIDIGAAILKNVRRLVSADVFSIIKNIPFDEALQLGADALGHLAKRAVAEVGGASNWPGSIDEIFSLIQNVLGSVWDPFVALVKHYGTSGLSKLFALGFGDGGFLAGRVLKQGGEFNDVDRVIEGVAKIGDELGEAAADLSDEAVVGLGKVINDVGEDSTHRFLKFSGCLVSSLADTGKIRGLASPLPQNGSPNCDVLEKVLEIVKRIDIELDEQALKGLSNLVEQNSQAFIENALNRLIQKGYSDEVINKTFAVLDKPLDSLSPNAFKWADKTLDGLAKTINRVATESGQNVDSAGQIIQGILEKNGRAETANNIFQWLDDLGDVGNIPQFATWLNGLADQSSPGRNFVGAVFELRYYVEKLSKEGVDTFQDYPDGKLGADFIMGDGRRIEVKSWESYNRSTAQYQAMVDQFRRNLGIDEFGNDIGSGRYGDQAYEYVFRGRKSNIVIEDLCRIARQAEKAQKLRNFNSFKIIFLDWPETEDLLKSNPPTSGAKKFEIRGLECPK